MNRYSMTVQWSEEDQLFLVTIPEFADDLRSVVDQRVLMPCTHGNTREQAIRNGEDVIEMYLEAWQIEGALIPAPVTRQAA
jgi:predicted RNase H-like HicB family nuclease